MGKTTKWKKGIIFFVIFVFNLTITTILLGQDTDGVAVPGITALTNKGNAILQAISGDIAKVVISIIAVILILLTTCNIIKVKWMIMMIIGGILITQLETVVNFFYG